MIDFKHLHSAMRGRSKQIARPVFCKMFFSVYSFLFFVFFFSLTLPATGYAQDTHISKSSRIELNDRSGKVYLGRSLFTSVDDAERPSEKTVVDAYKENYFRASHDSTLVNAGLNAKPFWMVFAVTNKSSSTDWVLHMGHAIDGRQGFAGKIYVHNVTSGEVFARKLSSLDESGIKNVVGPAVLLKIPKQKTQVFTVYLTPESGFSYSYVPMLMPEKDYIDSMRFGAIAKTLPSIFFISIIGFFVVLCVLKRSVSAFLCLGYYVCLCTLFFTLEELFLTGGLFQASYVPGFLVAAIMIALFMTRYFFRITREDFTNNLFIIVSSAVVLGAFIFYVLAHNPAAIFDDFILYVSWLSALSVICAIAIGHNENGQYGVIQYMLGFLCLLAGLCVSGLAAASILPAHVLLVNAFWFSLVPQAVFLIAAFIQKTNMMEEDKERLEAREIRARQSMIRLQRSKESADQARLLRVIERERELMAELREREMQRTEEMRQAKEMADEANRSKSAFLAVVSHEIRTPMTGIMGMVRLLLDTQMNKQQNDYVQAIQNSGDTMVALLNDILDFEKIESGNMEMEEIPCDVPKLAHGIVTLMSGHAAERNIRLTSEISDDFPEALTCDPTRLRQVLLNLVNNAIKFTEHGHVKIHIQAQLVENVSEGEDKNYDVTFAVEDTGIGLSAEAQEKLFSPFAQADKSTTRKYGGTGLGLAICKRLVEAMGSSISVKSEEGEGSTFHFTLVMKQTGMSAVQNGESILDAGTDDAEQERAAHVHPTKALNTLVIEDNEMNQKVFEGFLIKDGHEVTLAGEADEALEIIKTRLFDVILCDINLAGMSGIELTRAIRLMPDKDVAATPIIAVTGNVSDDDIKRYYEANMNGFIAKPIDPDALDAMIARVISGEFEQEVILPDAPSDGYETITAKPSGDEKITPYDSAPDKEQEAAPSPEPVDKKLFEQETPVAVQSEVNDQEVLNNEMLDNLKASLGQDAFDELLKGFWMTTDEIIAALIQARDEEDLETAHDKGHELKGMAANFGFTELSEIAAIVEKAAKDENSADCYEAIGKLPDANQRARDALREL